jgi:hypothetical protein
MLHVVCVYWYKYVENTQRMYSQNMQFLMFLQTARVVTTGLYLELSVGTHMTAS